MTDYSINGAGHLRRGLAWDGARRFMRAAERRVKQTLLLSECVTQDRVTRPERSVGVARP